MDMRQQLVDSVAAAGGGIGRTRLPASQLDQARLDAVGHEQSRGLAGVDFGSGITGFWPQADQSGLDQRQQSAQDVAVEVEEVGERMGGDAHD